jgi:hypothetical protein
MTIPLNRFDNLGIPKKNEKDNFILDMKNSGGRCERSNKSLYPTIMYKEAWIVCLMILISKPINSLLNSCFVNRYHFNIRHHEVQNFPSKILLPCTSGPEQDEYKQDVIDSNDTLKRNSTEGTTHSKKGGLIHGIVDSLVSPIGATLEKTVTNVLEHGIEQVAKQTTSRSFNSAKNHALDHIIQKNVGRSGEMLSERLVETTARSRSGLLFHTGEQITKQALGVTSTARKVVASESRLGQLQRLLLRRRTASIGVSKSAIGHVAGEITERSIERYVVGAGTHISEHVAGEVAERSIERLVKNTGSHMSEQSLKMLERKMGKSFLQAFSSRSFQIPVDLAVRIGNGCLLAVPILGGLFALSLSRHDVQRMSEEWSLQSLQTSLLFAFAGLADMLDALIHFWMSFVFYSKISFGKMHMVEELSTVCMICSTLCVLFGEFLSYRIHHCKSYSNGKTEPSSSTTDSSSTLVPFSAQ